MGPLELRSSRGSCKKLLVDRVTFTPVEIGNGKHTDTFSGVMSCGALLRDVTEYLHGDPSGTRPADSLPKCAINAITIRTERERTIRLAVFSVVPSPGLVVS